jgi:hypothetical protein
VRAERRARAGALDLVCRTAEGIVLCPANFFDYMMVRLLAPFRCFGTHRFDHLDAS